MKRVYDRLIGFFSQAYPKKDIRIRKKIRVLVPVTAGIGLLAIVLGGLMALTGALLVAITLVGLVAFSVFVLVLLRRGHYGAAASLFVYGLYLVMFAAIKFDDYQSIYETYVFSTLGLFLLLLVGLLSASSRHSLIMTLLVLSGVAALYFLDSFQQIDGGRMSLLSIQSMATCAVMILTGGILSAMIVRMQRSLVQESEAAARRSLEQYETMSEAVAGAYARAMDVSAKLLDAAEDVSAAASQMLRSTDDEYRGLASLDSSLVTNANSEHSVIAAQTQVQDILKTYSARVHASTKAIQGILEAVQDTGKAAEQRRLAVRELVQMARNGEEQMSSVVQAINDIVKASEQMDEMNSVIGSVADRTNLLGMNASIEAAHAGEAGKGFAVVAEEIRSLSEETAESSRSIAAMLAETRERVQLAATASKQTNSFFTALSAEIQELTGTLSDLLGRLQEIASGSSQVAATMEDFNGLAEEATKAAVDSTDALAETVERSASSRELAGSMRAAAAEMKDACSRLLQQATTVRELGKQNQLQMHELQASIAALGTGAESAA